MAKSSEIMTIRLLYYKVVIRKQYRDNEGNVVQKKNWVMTAFDYTIPKGEKKISSEKTLTTPLFDREADGVTLPSNDVSTSKDN